MERGRPGAVSQATQKLRRAPPAAGDTRPDIDLPPAVSRPLKVYAFDPSQGRALGNYLTIDVRYEKLDPGPTGKYLAVIDYDGANKCYYRAVNLDSAAVLIRGGLDPTESDPQFHQQMVYAVASETIRRFEMALGRSIRWSFSRWGGGDRTEDLAATMYHLLGIDPETEIRDSLNRPLPISRGNVITEVLA